MDKLRVLVMHGQRVLERMQGQTWETIDVRSEGVITPGIYNIFTAKDADKAAASVGMILHVDKDSVYQVIQKNIFVKHSASLFDPLPELGANIKVEYEAGRAKVTKADTQIRRGLSR